MLRQRIITALVLVPVIVTGVLLIETVWLAVFLGLVVCLGAWEWTKFAGIDNSPYGFLYVIITACLLVGSYLLNTHLSLWLIYGGALWWLVAFGIILVVETQKIGLVKSPLVKLCMGSVVLIPAWLSLITIHERQSGAMQLIFLFLLIWTADIAAYFSGKKWGKTHLAPQISPGKTWEGASGALLACCGLAFVYAITLKLQLYDVIIFLVISALTVIASITGDLLESLMKRSVNLKDSGNILPGHGGVLDRIDSITAAAPVFLASTTLMGASL